MNHSDAGTQVIAHALKDPDYRAYLLESPKAAIEELLGIALPEEADVTVHVAAPGSVHLVLPQVPEAVDLDDQDLRRVAEDSSSNYTSHFSSGPACSC